MFTAASLLVSVVVSGFANPAVAGQASSGELPRRGALGVGFSPLSQPDAMKYGLVPGEGMLVKAPLPGLTGEKAGLKEGDILLKINGTAVSPANIGPFVRTLTAGTPIKMNILRDGKQVELSTKMVEKPRDPGTADYTVEYRHIVNNGQRMRTIITKPKKPGKHPGFFFIQGFSPVSYDFTLATSTGDTATIDGPLLHDFAKSGFVTIRVEKPGVGDSEGGPFNDLDYNGEIGIYKETLKQLKGMPEVDTDNVFIFGHSMGAAFGPMVASENPVKGIAIYGGASRTWFEYLMDTVRYQSLLAGASFEAVDEEARKASKIMSQIFLLNKSAEDVKKSNPELAATVDAYFPAGRFNGKTSDFWRQLNEINFPSYWAKCNARVLSVKGESDYVVYEADHKLIADVVNSVKPGWGTFKIAPASDHLFHGWKTERDSMVGWTKGKFSLEFSTMMKNWMMGVMAETKTSKPG